MVVGRTYSLTPVGNLMGNEILMWSPGYPLPTKRHFQYSSITSASEEYTSLLNNLAMYRQSYTTMSALLKTRITNVLVILVCILMIAMFSHARTIVMGINPTDDEFISAMSLVIVVMVITVIIKFIALIRTFIC